jgi:hypothetical protein
VTELDRIVVVTKRTPLDELVDRFGSRTQAEFYIQHAGLSFAPYEAAHAAYVASRALLELALPKGARVAHVDREFLPNYLFGERDLVVTLGPDGLVVNAAKYLDGQPIVAFNPDPARIDGVLSRHAVAAAAVTLRGALRGERQVRDVSMARATLKDGQTIDAFNDLYIGQRTHVSSRYRLRVGPKAEDQSSSGILVATGAGSTGWITSVATGGLAMAALVGAKGGARTAVQRPADSKELVWAVREPFPSRATGVELACGVLAAGQTLVVESQMPENGVIFSDGVEKDYLTFTSGAVAMIGLAPRKARLVL